MQVVAPKLCHFAGIQHEPTGVTSNRLEKPCAGRDAEAFVELPPKRDGQLFVKCDTDALLLGPTAHKRCPVMASTCGPAAACWSEPPGEVLLAIYRICNKEPDLDLPGGGVYFFFGAATTHRARPAPLTTLREDRRNLTRHDLLHRAASNVL